MFKVIITLIIVIGCGSFTTQAQTPKYEVEVVTCIESLVPSGTGRSRMITTQVKLDYIEFTSHQTADKKDRNKSDRSDIRLKEYEETKLLNLYNEGGIRFQNLASNDAMVTSKINSMLSEGWELFFVATGVESKMVNQSIKKELFKMGAKMLLNTGSPGGNNKDPNGLFMTRYYFRKQLD